MYVFVFALTFGMNEKHKNTSTSRNTSNGTITA